MKLTCAVGGHSARAGAIYNSGYWFADCRRCGCTLLRTARSEWRTVPAGHRVVWAPGPRSHSVEADYAGVLPIVQPAQDAAVPALRSPFVSWSRSLTRFASPRPAPAFAVARPAGEEGGDYRYPRLLLFAVVLGAGLRMLLNLSAGR